MKRCKHTRLQMLAVTTERREWQQCWDCGAIRPIKAFPVGRFRKVRQKRSGR